MNRMELVQKKERGNHNEQNKVKEEEIIEAIADEVVFGEAIANYLEGANNPANKNISKEDIVKRFPKNKREEILADFNMIDFIQEMAKEEEEENDL